MLSIDLALKLGRFELAVQFASAGHITALFGRSGSGKTTLINLVAGLARPDRGRIVVGEAVLFDSSKGTDIPAARRRVGYIFQDGRLFPHLSVRQNLLYGERLTPAAERYVDLDQVVSLLGLEHLLARSPGALSGGEKQRAAIGRALLASPRVLLMDEPLASLDSNRKWEILQYIERLRDEVKIPIVYVSHAIEEVVRLADTVVVMSDGKAVAHGRPTDIMSRLDLHPALGRYERGAVIEAKAIAYDAEDDLTTLTFSGGQLAVTSLDALMGEPVRIRIRARDVSIALQRPRDVSILNVLPGRIAEIGDDSTGIVDVRIAVGEAYLLARLTRRSVRNLGLRVGLEVYALVKAISLDRHSLGFA
jgi:molybdate transport system ATP-binding protein